MTYKAVYGAIFNQTRKARCRPLITYFGGIYENIGKLQPP